MDTGYEWADVESLQPAVDRFAGWPLRLLLGLGVVFAVMLVGLLDSDRASAAEQGVVDTVIDVVPVVEPVVEPVLDTVVEPVLQEVVQPVVQPVVTEVVAPVLGAVLEPVRAFAPGTTVRPVVAVPTEDRPVAAESTAPRPTEAPASAPAPTAAVGDGALAAPADPTPPRVPSPDAIAAAPSVTGGVSGELAGLPFTGARPTPDLAPRAEVGPPAAPVFASDTSPD